MLPRQRHSTPCIQHPAFPRAFTLIELLVVISIIAVLIALLLPSLSKSKQHANTTVCQTRIRGLGTATATYLAEYNDSYPINGLLFPKSGVPQMYTTSGFAGANPVYRQAEVTDQERWRPEFGAIWPNLPGPDVISTLPPPPTPPANSPPLLPMLPTTIAKAYLCPTDVEQGLSRTWSSSNPGNCPLTLQAAPIPGLTTVHVGGPSTPGYWSYSINAVLNSLGRLRDNTTIFPNGIPWMDPMKQTSITCGDSNFIIFIEEDTNSLFNDEVFEPPSFRKPDTLTERLSDRHNGGGNVGFADNHVEWYNAIVFDNGPTQGAISRMFFPDGGAFLGAIP